jgi:hypothetical protein
MTASVAAAIRRDQHHCQCAANQIEVDHLGQRRPMHLESHIRQGANDGDAAGFQICGVGDERNHDDGNQGSGQRRQQVARGAQEDERPQSNHKGQQMHLIDAQCELEHRTDDAMRLDVNTR